MNQVTPGTYRLPSDNYNPFAIEDFELDHHEVDRGIGDLFKVSKAILTGSKLAVVDAVVAGPVTTLLLSGFWKVFYWTKKIAIALVMNEILERAIRSSNYKQGAADFAAMAYVIVVGQAIHTEQRKGPGIVAKGLWARITQGKPMYRSLNEGRAAIYKYVPLGTTSLIHVFLLNLAYLDSRFTPSECESLLETFDFSTFTKLEHPLPKWVENIGGYSLPDLFLERQSLLKRHISSRSSTCGGLFTQSFEIYAQQQEKFDYKRVIRGEEFV